MDKTFNILKYGHCDDKAGFNWLFREHPCNNKNPGTELAICNHQDKNRNLVNLDHQCQCCEECRAICRPIFPGG